MSANPLAVAARGSLRLLVWQLTWVVGAAVIGAIAVSGRIGGSLLAGGSIGVLWTLYMALTLYRHSVDYGARLSVASLFKAWLFKVLLTVSLLIVAFRAEGLAPLGVLGGLFGAMAAYWAWFALGLQERSSSGDRH